MWQRIYSYAVQMAQQEVDRLWKALDRVEQDIKKQQEQLLKATDPQRCAVIKDEKERLVQYKEALRQQLGTMQTQLAGPAGVVLAAAL